MSVHFLRCCTTAVRSPQPSGPELARYALLCLKRLRLVCKGPDYSCNRCSLKQQDELAAWLYLPCAMNRICVTCVLRGQRLKEVQFVRRVTERCKRRSRTSKVENSKAGLSLHERDWRSLPFVLFYHVVCNIS